MPKLRVTIVDEVRDRRLKVDLPDDAAMEKLLPALAKKLGLPATDPAGQPIAYRLTHEATGRALGGGQSLASFGVREGETLRLAAAREKEEAVSIWQKVPVWAWVLAVAVLAFLVALWVKPVPTPTVVVKATTPPVPEAPTLLAPTPTAMPVPPTFAPTSTPLPTDTPVPPTPTPVPPTAMPVPPTATPVPPTATLVPPTATLALPVVPTLDAAEYFLATFYYGFNVTKPPFDNLLVRQAFAHALNRQAIVDYVQGQEPEATVRPATNLTPPWVLGRDLYGFVGLSYNPDRARELLAQAGYPGGEGLGSIQLWFNESLSDLFRGDRTIAELAAASWRDTLGIEVQLMELPWGEYLDLLRSDSPPLWRLNWGADYSEPRNFLFDTMCQPKDIDEDAYYALLAAASNATSEEERFAIHRQISDVRCNNALQSRMRWSNPNYELLLAQARAQSNPDARRDLYIQAERILCETDVALVPVWHWMRPHEEE